MNVKQSQWKTVKPEDVPSEGIHFWTIKFRFDLSNPQVRMLFIQFIKWINSGCLSETIMKSLINGDAIEADEDDTEARTEVSAVMSMFD